ncbi:MAG: TetR/AcrR family transcriptional regulator [Caulobacterales bacterium]|uniref:TetR/AcrR family transcriptional regulator n=1 Tax=Glycocaulis sp. TaxID=1969725 RepID=UPI003FA186FC
MSEDASTRDRLVGAAARLFQERGYAATGLNEVLAVAGAPKGSLYHHFPDGKEGLAIAAALRAGQRFLETLRQDAGESRSTAELIVRFTGRLAGWLEQSEFQIGCPIATMTLEQAAISQRLAETLTGIFTSWQDALADRLVGDGLDAGQAREQAELALCTIEGALILARAQRSAEPVRRSAMTLTGLLCELPPLRPGVRKA